MSEELRPCPFCSSTYIIESDNPYCVYCDDCGVETKRTEWNNAFAWREADRLKELVRVLGKLVAQIRGEIQEELTDWRRSSTRRKKRGMEWMDKRVAAENALAEERKKFADAFPPHDCVAVEEKYLAAREVALYYYSLDENGVSKSLLAEQIDALDAEIEAKLKEKKDKQ